MGFPGRQFSVGGGGDFPGGSLIGGKLSSGNSLVGVLLEPFFSYNGSILIYRKVISKYNKTFNKKYEL